MLKDTSSIASAFSPNSAVQNSSPRVHLLKANLMSKASFNALSSFSRTSPVKPFSFSLSWLMPGASSRLPAPTA